MYQAEDGRWLLMGTVGPLHCTALHCTLLHCTALYGTRVHGTRQVSHGIKCAYPNLPGVYMRMTFYKPWIEKVTGEKFS